MDKRERPTLSPPKNRPAAIDDAPTAQLRTRGTDKVSSHALPPPVATPPPKLEPDASAPKSTAAWTHSHHHVNTQPDAVANPEGLAAPMRLPSLGERFVPGAPLGVGGMAEVVRLQDSVLGREVALKKLLPELGGSEATRKRFLREARIQGQLEHPAVVPVYDVGTDEQGNLQFLMRRIRGVTMAEVLQGLSRGKAEVEARFNRRKLLQALVQVCLAVHYAHTRGVLHLDLKPGNVMLGDFGEVYLLDWGIARLTNLARSGSEAVDGGDAPTLAVKGGEHAVGTPGYMSPEQLFGDRADLDHRADVYALGVILFELLTLQRYDTSTDSKGLLKRFGKPNEARPSLRRPDAALPPELDEVFARACAHDRDERFHTARELAEALERYLDGDRDNAARRDRAAELVREATARFERSQAEGVSPEEAERARHDALLGVTQALAFDPGLAEARTLLARMLLEPPRTTPPSLLRELEEQRKKNRIELASFGWRGWSLWALSFPLLWWLGVRHWPTVLLATSVTAAGALLAWHSWRREVVNSQRFYLLLVFGAVIAAAQSAWLGPFVLVPTAATVTSVLFGMYAEGRERRLVYLGTALAVLAPFGLEAAGLLPPSYTFSDGNMVLHPRGFDLQPEKTQLALLYTALTFGVLPGWFFGRFRDNVRRNEQQQLVQAWQIKQLLEAPSETRA